MICGKFATVRLAGDLIVTFWRAKTILRKMHKIPSTAASNCDVRMDVKV